MRPSPLHGPAFEAFVAPARRRPRLWRLMLGGVLAGAVWLATVAFCLRLALARGLGPGDPGLVIAYLFSFAGLAGGAALAARLLGGRGPATLIGPGGFEPRAFAWGALVVAGFATAGALAGALFDDPLRRSLALGPWLRALPLALPALAIQTAAEELAFRGFLLQGLAARFRAPPVWLGLPALVFGALHWDPATYGPNAPLVVANAALIGLILGDVTARRGNLSLAMGMHFANNAAALLLVAAPGPLSGLALWVSSTGPDQPAAFGRLLLVGLGATLACYALWLGWNRRGGRG
ncbi:CPBP family intramembrane glutamic endopeptidase [Amaricoccus solimangrovi]|uniref:CPBP family intramembrane metalloprotease n=1 Tax=Amaricoccus solimangrovi TaxID=2589815 RepID=A0A501WWA9_9RHOB|nr:type II CAAX endopeptidase family protein [Amaricoccus solimangrovi]TPE52730.1 CPBP family intramembrane metalloprotease [Amaricoccus solimangrovi]